MKVAVFSAKKYDREGFSQWADSSLQFYYIESRLNRDNVKLAAGCHAVCAFVNDDLNAAVLQQLSEMGIEMVALRCAGYNNVDIAVAKQLGLVVVPIPEVASLSTIVEAMVLLNTPWRSSSSSWSIIYFLAWRCWIFFFQRSAILFRGVGGMLGESSMVVLNLTRGASLGGIGVIWLTCSSTWHGGGDKHE